MVDSEELKMHTDVAEMKGMLVTALANHTARLEAQEGRLNTMVAEHNLTAGKVGELAVAVTGINKEIAAVKVNVDANRTESKHTHDKDIAEVKVTIAEVKSNQSGQLSKALVIITPIIAVAGFLLAMGDRLYS